MSLRAEAEAILHDRSKVQDFEREQLRRFAAAYLEVSNELEETRKNYAESIEARIARS